MARTPSRRLRRMMKQMGLKMDTLTDVEEVVIRGRDREIVIEEPIVAVLDMRGERVYQITGGRVNCLLYTSPSPRDRQKSRMPSSA